MKTLAFLILLLITSCATAGPNPDFPRGLTLPAGDELIKHPRWKCRSSVAVYEETFRPDMGVFIDSAGLRFETWVANHQCEKLEPAIEQHPPYAALLSAYRDQARMQQQCRTFVNEDRKRNGKDPLAKGEKAECGITWTMKPVASP